MTRPTIGLLLTLVLSLLVVPLAADAPPAGNVHRIGWLHYGSPPSRPGGSRIGGAFRQGLHELGWVEGQNLVIEERFAEWRLEWIKF